MSSSSEIASLRRQLAEVRTASITAGNQAQLEARRIKQEAAAEIKLVRDEAEAEKQRLNAEIQRLQSESDDIKLRVDALERRPTLENRG